MQMGDAVVVVACKQGGHGYDIFWIVVFYGTQIAKLACTMVRLMLMYYVDIIAFMENPEKTWNEIREKEIQKAPPEPTLFD